MTTPGIRRLLILLATLLCVVMLFAPLVMEIAHRLAEDPGPP